ncbi:hypothetical protein Gotur_031167 [Gossypium turneri]
MRTDGLGKTSEEWREEIREEINKSDRWKRKFQEADTLSVKYELESDRGQKLSSLLKRIKVLSIRAKPYL